MGWNMTKIINVFAKKVVRYICVAGLLALSHPTLSLAENGVTDDEILLGQSTALTGPLAELGQDSSIAAKAYFDYVNANGGVNGRKVRLITLDDGYSTDKGVANAKRLIEKDKVFALFNMISTPTNIALLPIITQAKIPNIAPYTGADALRKPFNRLIFHVRASYNDEIAKIVEHMEIRGITAVGVLYQNNAFGKAGFDGARQALAKHKVQLVDVATIENDASDADKAAATIHKGKPKAVIMITAGKPSVEFIKAYNKIENGMQYFMISVMGSGSAVRALEGNGTGAVVSQVGPFPFSATTPIVNEYQKIMTKMGVKHYSFASMEGFVDAKVTVEGLRRAGAHLTREKFIAALETMQNLDMDGYWINFNKTSHEGSDFVDLTVIRKNGEFMR
jgi:ABC-type branched-subunit amino acid transport system substrate-binding protein